MKIRNLIAVTPLPIILLACNSNWTEVQEKEYKEDCAKLDGVSLEQCDCAFDIFSSEYSYSQYNPSDKSTSMQNFSDEEKSDAVKISEEIRKCFE